MFKKAVSWLLGKPTNNKMRAVKRTHSPSDHDPLENYDHRYPPFPKGIPSVPLETIIDGQKDIIQQIINSKGLAGAHNQKEAKRQVLDAVTHFGKGVHLLPASEKQHFRTPGGLFRFGLENALFAIRYAERRMLTRETPEVRKDTEALWTHATFLAGLVSESILTISRLSVYSDSGLAWHPGVQPLYQWILDNNVKNYHLQWLTQEDRAMAVTVAGKTIPTEQAQILAMGEKSILSTLMSALYNPGDLNNPIVKINQSVRYKLIERDLVQDSSRYGKPMAGMHLEPWLIDAMRHLILNKRWRVNADMGRVWYGHDGVYLVWPLTANDIRHELKESKCPFVPNTVEIMAEILLDAKIIVNNGDTGNYLFDIAIPEVDTPESKLVTAIRLARQEILFGSVTYEPLDGILEVREPWNERDDVSGDVKEEQKSDPEIPDTSSMQPIPAIAAKIPKEETGNSQAYTANDLSPGKRQQTDIEKLFGKPEKQAKKKNPDPKNEIAETPDSRPVFVSNVYENSYSSDYDDDHGVNYPESKASVEIEKALLKGERPLEAFKSDHLVLEAEKIVDPDIKTALTESLSTLDALMAPQVSPEAETPKSKASKTEKEPDPKDPNAGLLGQLIRPSKPKTKENKKEEKTPAFPASRDGNRGHDPKSRSKMILDQLRSVPPEFLSRLPGGVTKVNTQGMQKLKLDIKDCVSVLNAAGRLVLVDGLELGMDQIGGKQTRYFLVKADLLDG
jgi:hypothetical protein